MPLLEVTELHAGYRNVPVIRALSLHVEAGEIVSVLGVNGAGKTTTLLTLSGVVRPTSGSIRFDGAEIAGLPPHWVAARGLVQVPEGRRVFPAMSVEENLVVGGQSFGPKSEQRERLARGFDLFPRLAERRSQSAGSLSGGEQQMLAIARALMGDPKLLMLDEPSLGLAPALVDLMFDTIQRIRKEGVGMLVVEQNVGEALEISDRAYVIEQGSLALTGTAEEVGKSDGVRAAYLGA